MRVQVDGTVGGRTFSVADHQGGQVQCWAPIELGACTLLVPPPPQSAHSWHPGTRRWLRDTRMAPYVGVNPYVWAFVLPPAWYQ